MTQTRSSNCQEPVKHRQCGFRLPNDVPSSDEPIRARYRILRELGSGGMGQVHLAFDRKLHRHVALKQAHHGADARRRSDLRREALALARVRDERVVAIYDYGADGDEHYLAMEYVAGVTLCAWQVQARHARQEVLAMYLEAGRGLLAIHKAGLVHRDFKPRNVLVGPDRSIKLADLGLAVLRGEDCAQSCKGSPAGTPTSLAPEQLVGARANAWADQFSFCLAIYRALYGAHPYAAPQAPDEPSSPAEIEALLCRLRSVEVQARPPVAHANDPLWPVLRRGLARAPESRYPSMRSLLEQLAAL